MQNFHQKGEGFLPSGKKIRNIVIETFLYDTEEDADSDVNADV